MLTVPQDPPVVDGIPSGIAGPSDPLPGGEVVTLYAFPDYFATPLDDVVDTLQIDFVFPFLLGAENFEQLVGALGEAYGAANQQVLAYAAWRKPELDVTVPGQVCLLGQCVGVPDRLCVPFTDLCIDLAGQTVASAFRYRLWLLSRDRPAFGLAAPVGVQAAPLGAAAILFVVLGLLTALAMGIGLLGVMSGQLRFRDLLQLTQDALHAPGENFAKGGQGLTWPFLAAGIGLGLAAIALPAVAASGTLSLPIGPAQVGLGTNVGTSGASPAGGRRR